MRICEKYGCHSLHKVPYSHPDSVASWFLVDEQQDEWILFTLFTFTCHLAHSRVLFPLSLFHCLHLNFSSCSWCSFTVFFLFLLLLLSVTNLNDFSFLMRFDWGFDWCSESPTDDVKERAEEREVSLELFFFGAACVLGMSTWSVCKSRWVRAEIYAKYSIAVLLVFLITYRAQSEDKIR